MLPMHLFRTMSLALTLVVCALPTLIQAQSGNKAVPPEVRAVIRTEHQTTPTPRAAGQSPTLAVPSPADTYNDAILRYRNLINLVTQITHARPEDLEQRLQALEAQLKAAAAAVASEPVGHSAAPAPPAAAALPRASSTLPTDLFATPETSDSPSAEPHVSQPQVLSEPESLQLLAESYERLAQQLEALAADLTVYAQSNRDIARQLRAPHR